MTACGVPGPGDSGNPAFDGALSSGASSVCTPCEGTRGGAFPAGSGTNLAFGISSSGNVSDRWNQLSNGRCGGNGFEIVTVTAARGRTDGGSNILVS